MTKSTSYFAAAGLAMIISLAGCEKKEYQSVEEMDSINIQDYIRKNNLNVQRYKETDLFYEVLEEGTGRPISYDQVYPIVYTVKSHDGVYNANDTLDRNNRYGEYFGYFPFGSSLAGLPNSPVEQTGDFKEVIREALQRTNGKIRIIVPSRLMYGRKGNTALGVPPNASMDYEVIVHDNFEDYEDGVIRNAIAKAGLDIADFTKREDNIYYHIITPGDGDVITTDSTVTVDYTLRNPAGVTIDSGTDAEFSLGGGTIEAWPKIIPLIKKGGKIRFFTPSAHAYGLTGSSTGSIGPFLTLDFEVEVKK
ncbi:FKBP-type peptidyl-prolyl cis-trans isomerase [Parapedobacter lycopersici]|uniref:FKBP-type peptidyl-prolyl cis-trans isomerase n=1 Tax=Parapedobacter lycopersici TaxID=1864939 RepID=UPI00214DC07C|nr:FKBP-type peptidyl-prolyl cis-trans isomerase [Parapedobacter lycopersici]